jgi:uncharacterized membrane protein YczE
MSEDIKPKPNMWIMGVNIIVLVLYATLCYAQGDNEIIAMWLAMLAQVVICFIIGIITALIPEYRANALPWILSSVVVLLIGLSTCYMATSNMGHM